MIWVAKGFQRAARVKKELQSGKVTKVQSYREAKGNSQEEGGNNQQP